jgi:hypothetical protein
MPTPRAIIHQHVGQQLQQGQAHPQAEEGGEDGQAHGHHRPEGDEHDEHGGQDAGPLGRPPGIGRHHGRDGGPAQGHGHPGPGGAVGGIDDPLHRRLGQGVGLSVELHRGVGDMAPGGDLVGPGRAVGDGHRGHVGQVGHPGQDGRQVSLHRRVGDPARGGEDDLGLVAGLGREPAGQDVLGPLGGRVPGAELVLEVGAGHLGHHGGQDDQGDPEQEDQAAAVVRPAGQAPEAALGRRTARAAAGVGLGGTVDQGSIHH